MTFLFNSDFLKKNAFILVLFIFCISISSGFTHLSSIPFRDDNLQLGNPSNASTLNSDNYLIKKEQYSLSYNNSKGEPNWVSWHLNKWWKGDAKRCNCFASDFSLPDHFYKVSKSDYTKTGFDRGHVCPSDDRDASEEDNQSTFLMTNMLPQAPHLNRITWVALEEYCRKLVQEGDELYIIAGGYGSGGVGSNNILTYQISEKINVPSHCWKIIVVLSEGNNDLQRINKSTRVIAVDMPNNQTVNELKWTSYRVSVDEIEKNTGFDFLNKIPKDIQSHLESEIDKSPVE